MKKFTSLVAVIAILGIAATAPAIVINEFMYTTEGGNAYIELFNRTAKNGGTPETIDISGWKVQQGTDAGWTDIATVDAGTTLTAGTYYLIATQDVFVTLPDQEEDFMIEKPLGDVVLGLRLVADDASATDTVLYAVDNAAGKTFGVLTDDALLAKESRLIPTTGVRLPGGGTVNIDTNSGSGVRREDADGDPIADGDDGDGADSNDAYEDFWGFEVGSASPRSTSTPVRLAIFEVR